MISKMPQEDQNTVMGFFKKYKKWFLVMGIFQIPGLLLTIFLVGGIVCTVVYAVVLILFHSLGLLLTIFLVGGIVYVAVYYRAHPFQSTIVSGFEVGLQDGKREYNRDKNRPSSPWSHYDYETDQLEKKALAQKEAHLAQFLESERGARRAEMKRDNIKLPLELELKKRFTNGLEFCTDFVEKKVKRENYETDKVYHKALQEEAWKIGYEEGYREGSYGISSGDLDSFKHHHRKL
jgi:hypothetical protein